VRRTLLNISISHQHALVAMTPRPTSFSGVEMFKDKCSKNFNYQQSKKFFPSPQTLDTFSPQT